MPVFEKRDPHASIRPLTFIPGFRTLRLEVKVAVDAFNDFVPQTQDAQIFRATIKVTASGCTPLDQRDVLILVPPAPIVIQ